jgi:hypothetical protein
MFAEFASVPISLLLIGIAIFSPPLMLAIYSIFSNIADGFAIGCIVRLATSQLYTSYMSMLLLIAVVASYYRMYKSQPKNIIGKRFLLGSLVFVCTLWIGLIVPLKGGNILSIPNSMTNYGIPCMVIVLAYYQSQFARYLFFTCILLQLVLAFFIVMYPDSLLSSISAVNYEASGITDFSLFSQTYNFGIARFSNQGRLFAQFYNPNGYGFYAVMGIIVGCYVLINRKYNVFERFLGGILSLFGFFGWSVTFSRGTTFGLLFGTFFAYIISLKNSSKNKKYLMFLSWLITFIFWFLLIVYFQPLKEIILLSYNDAGVAIRGGALSQGIEVLSNNFLLGAPLNFIWNDDTVPHQIMIYSAAVYGIFFGLIVTLIFLVIAIGNIYNNTIIKEERYLFLVISFVTTFTGLTNNFAVPILFWVAVAISCIPWCLQRE